MTHYTIRNDMRVVLFRSSSDSAWPIRRADGSRPCDERKHYQVKELTR